MEESGRKDFCSADFVFSTTAYGCRKDSEVEVGVATASALFVLFCLYSMASGYLLYTQDSPGIEKHSHKLVWDMFQCFLVLSRNLGPPEIHSILRFPQRTVTIVKISDIDKSMEEGLIGLAVLEGLVYS